MSHALLPHANHCFAHCCFSALSVHCVHVPPTMELQPRL